jgi:carbamate kinase
VQLAGGWRRTVASPRPQAVVEEHAIATLLREHHVIAGGGGGIALVRMPVDLYRRAGGLPGVIDKDWVAAHLAITLKAQALVFATDVAGVEDGHGTPQAKLLERLTATQAQRMLSAGMLGAGSMAPKVDSALAYARATGRPARILHVDRLAQAMDAAAPGTLIED